MQPTGPKEAVFLEWAGCLVALAGAALLACNTRFSPIGWAAFLAANVLMICFAWKIRRSGLLVQQVGFTATSILGLCRADFSEIHALIAGFAAGLIA